jgi:hypothetical protein
MLKNASAFGDSLMSPLVLAYAIVDTVLLLVVLDFGITLARDIQNKYEHIPELKKLISLATIVLVLLFAYNVYKLPTACLVVQPTDLINLSQSGTPTAFGQINATAMQNAGGEALASYQQLAVAVLQRSGIYGWTFLILIALPTVGIVTLISRHRETFSELLSHTGAALVTTTTRRLGTPAGANVRSAGGRVAGAGESLSTREVIEKLTRLKSLWDSGTISKDDFKNQKTRVLGRALSNSKPAEPDDFQKLKSLLDSGALSEEEYQAYKEHLLELI